MNQIEAAAALAFSATVFMGLADARTVPFDRKLALMAGLTAIIGVIATAWAIDRADSMSGALILVLVPIGAASIGASISLALIYRFGDFRGRSYVMAFAAIAFFLAYGLGFPTPDEPY